MNIYLRICDKFDTQGGRILSKPETVKYCFLSLIRAFDLYKGPKQLNVVFDKCSDETKMFVLRDLEVRDYAYWYDFTQPEKKEWGISDSRQSLKFVYDKILKDKPNGPILFLEDDYYFEENGIQSLVDNFYHFKNVFQTNRVGIFPCNFRQLYTGTYMNIFGTHHIVMPGFDRYFRSTNFTHETFMIDSEIFYEYYDRIFKQLLEIGSIEGLWEGNTISDLWMEDNFFMMMPLRSIATHISKKEDIPFFTTINMEDSELKVEVKA